LEGYYFFREEIRRTLKNLAADASEQALYLKELGVSGLADELALEFDDISSRVGQAVEEDLVSPDTASAIQELSRVLQAMSGDANARLWSIDGLQSAEWDVVRRHARTAMDLYDADLKAGRGGQTGELPSAPDLYSMASAVDSKASFLEFVLALAADRTDELQKERVHPSSPYGPGANGWENGSIEAFLDAAAAWGGATSAITGEPSLSDAPSWRAFALFLLAGKDYE
jgi:hypothetical protein